MRILTLITLSLFHIACYGQLGVDSLNINAINASVFADGNIQEIKLKPSGRMINYLSQLHFAAIDSTNKLLTAAQYYHQNGRDFRPGPISTNPFNRAVYNKVWKINKTTVDSFVAGYFTGNIPPSIANWPAHGDQTYGESFYLAPFVDANGNGFYNPTTDGDYPCFPGDQAIFFVYNDETNHSKTLTDPLGIEILGLAYAYASQSFLDSVIFVKYTIRIKNQNLFEFRAGSFNDFDIGNWADDLIGCFLDQNTSIAYNADSLDEGPIGHGTSPPSGGMAFRVCHLPVAD